MPIDQLTWLCSEPEDCRQCVEAQARVKNLQMDELVPMLEDDSMCVRMAAHTALANALTVAEAWLLLTDDKHSHSLRCVAVDVLTAHPSQMPIQALLQLIFIKQGAVAAYAVQVLCGSGIHMPIEQLTHMAADHRYWVRRNAATILGFAGERKPMPVLGGLLRDSHTRVRVAAIQALAYGEAEPPVEVLLPMLTDSHQAVRKAAFLALTAGQDPLSPAILHALRAQIDREKPAIRDFLQQFLAERI